MDLACTPPRGVRGDGSHPAGLKLVVAAPHHGDIAWGHPGEVFCKMCNGQGEMGRGQKQGMETWHCPGAALTQRVHRYCAVRWV